MESQLSNKRLKILHVGKFYPPHKGGIESHVQVLCRQLQKVADIQVLVANENSNDEECWDGQVKIVRAGARGKISSAPLCFSMPRKIKQARANLIHIHLPNPPAVLALLASGYRGPVVITYHSDIVRQRFMGKAFEPFLRRLLSRSAAIVVSSPRYIETSPILRDYKDRCHLIPFGVSLDQFNALDSGGIAGIRERFGSRLIVSVGRLIYYKGFEYLIAAMKDIDGHLLIIGDGPLRQQLESQVERLGIQHKVTLLGEFQGDITAYFRAAEVFVLPSVARSEAFGIVQLEAMACGKPVVNTSLDSGVPWVSQDGVTGITVPPKDPAALADAINTLLDDEALRTKYGNAARQRVEKEFTQELMIARMLDLYRDVLSLSVPQESLRLTEPATDVKNSALEISASSSV